MYFIRIFYIFLVFTSVFCHYAEARTGRALIVAIGEYPAESGWEIIHGDHDGILMAELLKDKHYQQIILLKNKEATKNAICMALQQLCDDTKPGDFLFLHFSCHGQQMMDLNGDEEDGLDEALIPYDALFWYIPGVYEGKNHLCDDELGEWIYKLRHKAGNTGQVFVLLDACHSGTANRYAQDLYIRGVNKIFAPDDYQPQRGKHPERSMKLKPLKNLAPALVISACKPEETNYEYYCRKSKRHYGKLTYCFQLAAKQKPGPFTAKEWHATIDKAIQQLSPQRRSASQHPYMECSDTNALFTLSVIH